ncbi:MAG TPA: SIS domain-containing protein [Terriglobales bacterium]|nr:SIS domain-containing protein [Terriglobales bacterium]
MSNQSSSHSSSVIANDGNNPTTTKAGAHSLAEILSQPECWQACIDDLRASKKLEQVNQQFAGATEWLFIGCGSSYYVALSAAATMSALTGLRARAIPASEILLYPDQVLSSAINCVPVLISRSGRTSEVLNAAELLKSRGVPTLAISCAPGQPLEELATNTILLPSADEQSTVMTRSFSSMLLTLQSLAATIAGDSDFLNSVSKLPTAAAPNMKQLPGIIHDFVAAQEFADYVYLGQGPFYGLTCEGALKVTEMSVSYAQAFHTLEFRHGPKSIVGPETLLVFMLSEAGYQAECEVLEEMKSLGGTTVAIVNKSDKRIRAASDLVVELNLDVPELARLAVYLSTGQLIGLYSGLKKGLDPDSPRNLTRAVVLKG